MQLVNNQEGENQFLMTKPRQSVDSVVERKLTVFAAAIRLNLRMSQSGRTCSVKVEGAKPHTLATYRFICFNDR